MGMAMYKIKYNSTKTYTVVHVPTLDNNSYNEQKKIYCAAALGLT
jgi:hypothetical protein